ncbi:MAG: LacI family DNA-binding transcriptional regulator [Lachnospiraceae bacterium]|nr:LacI family DNA-binding transcriptional regulator [Lachnospiraceae bacterium]
MNHYEDEQKNIGLIVEDVYADFNKEIVHSVAHAVIGRKDINLILLAGRQDESEDPADRQHQYKMVYNTIFELESACRFDGLIFTLPNPKKCGRLLESKIPRVFIATDAAGEICVNYDDEIGIRETVAYLVNVKDVTRLCMLGGRDDNTDAIKRKKIFARCLSEYGLDFTPEQYEKTDMSIHTEAAAARLLKRNPDVQAIFCVNDQSACGLYNVLNEKGLVPGRDVMVFGFDNTRMAGDMIPPLSSIGTDTDTLGKRALELLLQQMNGIGVVSVNIPTRLFGRDSLDYIMYEYTRGLLQKGDPAFIYQMFNDCFYRYRNEIIDPGDIDLKRLFFEIISRMVRCIQNRYMSEEEAQEIARLGDLFFENRAMEYTDANHFVYSIKRMQSAMNENTGSVYVNIRNNRLLSEMRDKAIISQFTARNMERRGYERGRDGVFQFLVESAGFDCGNTDNVESVVECLKHYKVRNAALYLFEEPLEYREGEALQVPETIRLRCVVRYGELYVIPRERQECPMSQMFSRQELIREGKGLTAYPLFFGRMVYGYYVCNMDRALLDTGEYMAQQLSRAIYVNRKNG